MLWRQANRGTEKTSLSLPRAWGKQGAFSSYRVPPKQGSHAQSVPELETAERQPGSSSEFDIRYSFLPLLFNFIRSKGKKNPFEFLLFFLNRKKRNFFFSDVFQVLILRNVLTEPSFLGYTYRIQWEGALLLKTIYWIWEHGKEIWFYWGFCSFFGGRENEHQRGVWLLRVSRDSRWQRHLSAPMWSFCEMLWFRGRQDECSSFPEISSQGFIFNLFPSPLWYGLHWESPEISTAARAMPKRATTAWPRSAETTANIQFPTWARASSRLQLHLHCCRATGIVHGNICFGLRVPSAGTVPSASPASAREPSWRRSPSWATSTASHTWPNTLMGQGLF